jgi:hypothetical protein
VVLLSGEFHVDRTVTRRPPGRSRWRRAASPTEIVGLNTIWIVAKLAAIATRRVVRLTPHCRQ